MERLTKVAYRAVPCGGGVALGRGESESFARYESRAALLPSSCQGFSIDNEKGGGRMAAAGESALSDDRVEMLAMFLGGGISPDQKNWVDLQGFLCVDVGL